MMWKFEEYRERTAAIDAFGAQIRYGELEELAQMFRLSCHRKLVFQLCKNTLGSVAGYAAMLQAETVVLMLAQELDQTLLKNLMDIYEPDFVWIPADKQTLFGGMQTVFASFGYVLLKTGYPCTTDCARMHPDLALLLATSGSTGSPKLVRQSYENIRANTQSIAAYLDLDASERPITTLPMNYTYGLSVINTHLYVGATILVTDRSIMQKEFWEFAKQEGATSIAGVPYTYEMLWKLHFTDMELPRLQTMTQAGGKLAPKLHRAFAAYAQSCKKKFIVMYGQTEATARMAYLPPGQALEKCGSMGIAIPGGSFLLVDTHGNEIREPDTQGELLYRGANVTLGYAETKGDLAKGDERGGILYTGDLAVRDSDGYYYIVGRKSRFLKLYGKRVNLDEVERMVKEVCQDTDCACCGMDDLLLLFLDQKKDRDFVRAYIAEKIQVNRAAVRVVCIDAIPKNSAGKTCYAKLMAYEKNVHEI